MACARARAPYDHTGTIRLLIFIGHRARAPGSVCVDGADSVRKRSPFFRSAGSAFGIAHKSRYPLPPPIIVFFALWWFETMVVITTVYPVTVDKVSRDNVTVNRGHVRNFRFVSIVKILLIPTEMY